MHGRVAQTASLRIVQSKEDMDLFPKPLTYKHTVQIKY